MRRWLAVLTVALLTGGCGVTTQNGPTEVSDRDLSQAGQPDEPATSPKATPTQGTGGIVQVYFVRGQRLFGVSRTVDHTDVPGPALEELLVGPTRSESTQGVSTAIPAGTPPLEVTVVEGIAVVAVPPQLDTLTAPEQIVMVAQLVYTLTGINGIVGLQLSDGRGLVDVPNGSGELSYGPVYRADFGSIAPPADGPGSPPTTTAAPTPTG
jgi:spore germination protein GerM